MEATTPTTRLPRPYDAARLANSNTSANKVSHAPSKFYLHNRGTLTPRRHRQKLRTRTPRPRHQQRISAHDSSIAPARPPAPAPAQHPPPHTTECSIPHNSSPSSNGYAHKTQRTSGCSSKAAPRSCAMHTPRHARAPPPPPPPQPPLRPPINNSARGWTRRSAR